MDEDWKLTEEFEVFWRHFVRGHESAAVRWCHVAALGSGVLGAVTAVATLNVIPLILGAGVFAALAVFSHPVFTGTWPENFGRPMWGARAFVRLCLRTLAGTIGDEIAALESAAGAN